MTRFTLLGDKTILFWLGLLGLFGFALYAFTLDVNFGLPQRLHPDEWSQVEIGLSVAQGQLNPGFFRYPSFHIYLTSLIYSIMALFKSDWSLPQLYLTGRLISVLFSLGTLILVVLWANALLGRLAGIFAGLALVLTSTSIEHAHYAIVDVPLAFWTTSALLVLTLIVSGCLVPGRRWLIVASILVGIALGNKYSVVFLIFPLILVSFFETRDAAAYSRRGRQYVLMLLIGGVSIGLLLLIASQIVENQILMFAEQVTTDGVVEREYVDLYKQSQILIGTGVCGLLLLAVLFAKWSEHPLWPRLLNKQHLFLLTITLAIFLVTSPYLLLDWKTAAIDFFYEVRHAQIGAAAHRAQDSAEYESSLLAVEGVFPSAEAYARLLLSDFGLLSLLLSSIGFVFLLFNRRKVLAVILVFLVPTVLTLVMSGNFATRYTLNIYPVVALMIGGGAVSVSQMIRQPRMKMSSGYKFVLIGLVILVFVIPLISSIRYLDYFQIPDNRTVAWEWAANHIDSGASIAQDWDTIDFEMAPIFAQVTIGEMDSISVLDANSAESLHASGYDYLFSTQSPDQLQEQDSQFSSYFQEFQVFDSGRNRPIYSYQATN